MTIVADTFIVDDIGGDDGGLRRRARRQTPQIGPVIRIVPLHLLDLPHLLDLNSALKLIQS